MNKRTTVWVLLVVLLVVDVGTAKRILGSSNRKSSPSRSSPSRVTPSYSRPSSSHSDAAKLSYPNYNSQPNRPASAPAAGSSHASAPSYGWNVPQKSGPPPAYSATNPVGGARTNVNEKPPAYNPSYGSSSNVHSPISATNVKNTQSGYPAGATYHSPGNVPAGATYYPHGGAPAGATYHAPGNLPGGATYYPHGGAPAGATYHAPGNLPAGATYHAPGSIPAGATYHPGGFPASGGYHPPPAYGGGYHPAGGASYPAQQLPAGATYIQPGSALPPGAVLMSQPPKSSGLGFGSGLLAGGLTGAIGGALLTNALTPSHTQHSYAGAPAVASGSDSGSDRIIIINNGQPVDVTEAGKGTTVINTGGAQPAPAAPGAPAPGAPAAAGAPPAPAPAAPGMNPPMDSGTPPLAPMVPLAPLAGNPGPSPMPPNADSTPAPNADSTPAPGGIICVPVKVNETDPNDATKMIEVEKIACYPAPPPEPAVAVQQAPSENLQAAPQTTPQSSDSSLVPLAPLNAVPSHETLIGNDAMVRSKAPHFADSVSLKMGMLLSAIWSIAYTSRIFAF